jgi:RNA polymerase sigma-70 factor (ECF subfamily)
MAEERLIKDEEYFERLFRSHFDQLYVRAFGWLNDSEQAKDAVFESFEYLWEHLDRYHDRAHLLGLLYRLVYSRCMDELRTRRSKMNYVEHRVREAKDSVNDSDYDFEDYEERLKKMREVIADFSPRMKEAFTACVLNGKSYSQAAVDMGVGQETVKTMIRRAYKILRGKLIFLLFFCTPLG